MKIFFYLAFAIAIASCHTSKTSTGNGKVEESNASHLEGGWKLQMLFASQNNWAKVPVVNFNVKDNIFLGNSGCNNIRGKFATKESYLGFDKNILSTKMACADLKANQDERSFFSCSIKNKQVLHK